MNTQTDKRARTHAHIRTNSHPDMSNNNCLQHVSLSHSFPIGYSLSRCDSQRDYIQLLGVTRTWPGVAGISIANWLSKTHWLRNQMVNWQSRIVGTQMSLAQNFSSNSCSFIFNVEQKLELSTTDKAINYQWILINFFLTSVWSPAKMRHNWCRYLSINFLLTTKKILDRVFPIFI
jgi:hypothetical protein